MLFSRFGCQKAPETEFKTMERYRQICVRLLDIKRSLVTSPLENPVRFRFALFLKPDPNPMTIRSLTTLAVMSFIGVSSSLADSYKIDPVDSSIIFHVLHFGASSVYGRFDSFAGDFSFDPSDPSKASLALEIKTDSIDTNSAARDKDLKGPDFLNAVQFGTATFKTTSAKKVDDKTVEVTGDLTLRGVTKPVTATVKEIGIGKGPKGEERIGFETSFQLKRSDFDIKYGLPAIGDDVFVTVACEGIKS